MSGKEIAEKMQNDDTVRSSFKEKVFLWEQRRSEGKRREGGGRSSRTKVQAEESTATQTKEVLGYLWPVALLRQHKVESANKRLTTITHAGRKIKGLTRLTWVLGAIEMPRVAVGLPRESESVR